MLILSRTPKRNRIYVGDALIEMKYVMSEAIRIEITCGQQRITKTIRFGESFSDIPGVVCRVELSRRGEVAFKFDAPKGITILRGELVR